MFARRPMKVFDNRTPKKDHKKSKTNIINDHNSMSTKNHTIIVINQKENKNPRKCTNIKNLKYYIKSSNKSGNKADKQKFEAKTVIGVNL